jgi:ubiquinone/menaquinone biosynthesis C-methylase UbiE
VSEFQKWQDRYAAGDYVFGTAPNAFLAAQQSLLPKTGRALAVADGEGRNGIWLAEQGLDVLSIDFSPNALAKARELAKQRGVTPQFELANAIEWSWPNQAFDVIAAIFIQFAGPADRDRIFAGIRTALKPGGLLLMIGYSPKQLEYCTGGPSDVENLYTRALLERAFGDFSSVQIKEYEAEINEGTRHAGKSALIDLIGLK